MTRRINYDDDIFLLALHVRCLKDTLKLEIDPEFFRDRVLDEIAWVDSAIGRIFQSLRTSPQMVRRQEHMQEILKLKRAFTEVLSGIVERSTPFSGHLVERIQWLAEILAAQEKSILEIKALLAGEVRSTQEEESIVSAEELKFLMTSHEEEG